MSVCVQHLKRSAYTKIGSLFSTPHLLTLPPCFLLRPLAAPTLCNAGARCQLGRRSQAYKFKDALLSAYVAAVFHSIVAGRVAEKKLEAPAPQLSRFDLWHGHLFVVPGSSTGSTSSTSNSSRTSAPLSGRGEQPHNVGILVSDGGEGVRS